jgi:hypothetical protein
MGRSPWGPFETKQAPQPPPRTILLISASRADAVRPLEDSQMPRRERLAAAPHHFLISASRADAVRPLEDSQMPRRERLAAAPHHFTDQRLEGRRGQAPREFADAKTGALSRRPAPFY